MNHSPSRVRPASYSVQLQERIHLQGSNLDSPQSGWVDTGVGVIFGLLAGCNLVQGMWLEMYPWLDLTAVAFFLAVPALLAGLRRRTTLTGAIIILVLLFALALGYLEPALSENAGRKRISLVIGVAFVFVASFVSLTNARRLKSFYFTLVCLAGVVVLGQLVVPDPFALVTGRLTPIGLNAIGSGRAVGSALVLVTAALFARQKARWRLLLALSAVVFCVSLYLNSSRGPVVGVLVTLIAVISVAPRPRLVAKLTSLSALGVATLLAYNYSVTNKSRLGDLTSSGRDDLYSQVVRIASAHPLGIGWGNFNTFAPASVLGAGRGDNLYAHNIVLEFWIEAGILGAVAFVAVAICVLVNGLRAASASSMGLALAALVVNLLTGAMLSSDVVGNRMMWVVFGAVLAGQTSGSAQQDANAKAANLPISSRSKPRSPS